MQDTSTDHTTAPIADMPRGLFIGDNGQALLRHGDIDMAFSQTDPDQTGGLCWSLSHFRAPGPLRELEVSGSRGTDYLFTQVPLVGGFEAEMTCGTTVTGTHGGLMSPGEPLMNFRFREAENRGFGVEASLDAIERWFGDDVPPAIREMLRSAGRGSFYRPAPLPSYLVETLNAALANTRPQRDRLVEGAALLILAHQLEAMAEADKPAGLAPHELRAARDAHAMMQTSATAPPGPATLAANLGVPVRRLSQAYKSVFGVSLMQGADQIRLELAQKALLDGQPIKLIASDLGYANVSNFTAAFRRRMGVPPRRWRDLQASV